MVMKFLWLAHSCSEIWEDQETTSSNWASTCAAFIPPMQPVKFILSHTCQQGGSWHKCHNKTVSSFFSFPLGFVFLHGYGISVAILEAKWSLLNWHDPESLLTLPSPGANCINARRNVNEFESVPVLFIKDSYVSFLPTRNLDYSIIPKTWSN